MDLIHELERELGKPISPDKPGRKIPFEIHVGDNVDVHYLIREGEKERIQIFSGTIIAIQGRGIRASAVVRRIVGGEGVERTFPLHGPRVQDIKVTRRGRVRRSRLYFLRDRVGKATRVRELLGDKARKERDEGRVRIANLSSEAEAAAAASSSEE